MAVGSRGQQMEYPISIKWKSAARTDASAHNLVFGVHRGSEISVRRARGSGSTEYDWLWVSGNSVREEPMGLASCMVSLASARVQNCAPSIIETSAGTWVRREVEVRVHTHRFSLKLGMTRRSREDTAHCL